MNAELLSDALRPLQEQMLETTATTYLEQVFAPNVPEAIRCGKLLVVLAIDGQRERNEWISIMREQLVRSSEAVEIPEDKLKKLKLFDDKPHTLRTIAEISLASIRPGRFMTPDELLLGLADGTVTIAS